LVALVIFPAGQFAQDVAALFASTAPIAANLPVGQVVHFVALTALAKRPIGHSAQLAPVAPRK